MTDRFATLRHGLVGAWCPSLDGIGTLIPDRGNRRNNLANAASRFVSQRGGFGFYATGSSDAAVASSSTAQRALNGATAATLCGWLRRASSTAHVGFGFTGDSVSGARFSMVWFVDNNVYCNAENGSAAAVFTAVTLDAYIHVALTFDGSLAAGSRATMYVNGAAQSASSTGTIPTTLSSSLGTFVLGRDNSTRLSSQPNANGWIDDVRVYDRVLTRSEIRLLASQRGIGLVPTRHRRSRLSAAAATTLWLNVGGTWKATTPKINIGGTWKTATPKVNVGGVWKG